MNEHATPSVYPLQVEGELDGHLSRWLWLVKWVLVIPHVIVLVFLWIAFFGLTVVAFFAILFTGRYPRAIFDFNVGVLRWSWRVGFYSYSALGTERYPPFTLADVPDYPARLNVEYPRALSRGLVLVKWWLLALPHYLVVAVFAGGAWAGFNAANDDWAWTSGGGLIGLLVLIAGVALLFTGRYPRAIFDFNLGVLRWTWRVGFYSYSALGTDRYPPFTLADVPDYPARLHVEYPHQLSRGLVLVKWWLLALPQYLVVGVFAGGAWAGFNAANDDWAWTSGGGLIGLLVLIAGVVLLFTGRYPRSIFDFVMGMNRWCYRVAAYATLMTDAYPPFRLDMGGQESAPDAAEGNPVRPKPAAGLS